MNPAEANAMRILIAKLEKENLEMRKLSTRKGFYNEYFIALKTAKTNIEAFNTVNENYHKLFGHYRYSDWNSFKKMTNYYNNQNKK